MAFLWALLHSRRGRINSQQQILFLNCFSFETRTYYGIHIGSEYLPQPLDCWNLERFKLEETEDGLNQWFSNFCPWTSCLHIIYKLVRNKSKQVSKENKASFMRPPWSWSTESESLGRKLPKAMTQQAFHMIGYINVWEQNLLEQEMTTCWEQEGSGGS